MFTQFLYFYPVKNVKILFVEFKIYKYSYFTAFILILALETLY